MLFIFQWICYGICWLIGYAKYRDGKKAYYQNPFEQQAYDLDDLEEALQPVAGIQHLDPPPVGDCNLTAHAAEISTGSAGVDQLLGAPPDSSAAHALEGKGRRDSRCVVVDVHADDAVRGMYYTVSLQGGMREVQTEAGRLRAG